MTGAAAAPSRNRGRDLLLVALFTLFLLTPAALHILGIGQSTARDEMRDLVVRPRFPTSLGAWRALGGELDAYLADRFGLRPALVTAANRLSFAFRLPAGKSVIAGRDDWLYSNFYGEIDQYAGLQLLSQAQIAAWVTALKRERDWLAARGIKFLFVIVPDKSEIYPEHLPEGLPRGRLTPADQILAALKRDGTIDFVDLAPVLRAAKATGQIYYRTDNHWNPTGAYHGLAAVMRGRWPAGITLPPLADYRIDPTPFYGPLAMFLKLQCCIREPRNDLVRTFPDPVTAQDGLAAPDAQGAWINTDHAQDPSIFLIADSFSWAWFQLLPDVARRVVYRRHGQTIPTALIEKEKPAILIYELTESYLVGPPDRLP
jgi:alginate O-acetyltransferase complex protein AlgJ